MLPISAPISISLALILKFASKPASAFPLTAIILKIYLTIIYKKNFLQLTISNQKLLEIEILIQYELLHLVLKV